MGAARAFHRPVYRCLTAARATVLAAVLAISVSGCGLVGPIEVELPATAVIRGTTSWIPGAGGDFAGWAGASAAIARTVDNQGVKPGDLKSARLARASITVLLPEEEDGHLGYLERFAIYIEAPGLERRRIAHHAEAFASNPVAVELVLDDVELLDYVVAESLTLAPDVVIARPPRRDVEIEVVLTLELVPALGG